MYIFRVTSLFLLLQGSLIIATNLVHLNTYAASQTASYFPADYLSARNNFRGESKKWTDKHANSVHQIFNIPSETDTDLTVDSLYISAQKKKEKLVILISGVHGVEAFAGSAIQSLFFTEILPTISLANTGVLLIHSLNPYGFKNLRRVTESNVDLNRNMAIDNKLYQSANHGYDQLYDLLNPATAVDLHGFSHNFSFLKMVYHIVRHSMKTVRQAVLQGQYQHQKGLYFGGFKAEPQLEITSKLLDNFAKDYKSVMAIDLHTGYGKRGHLHLFGDSQPTIEQKKLNEKVFANMRIDTGDDKDFYDIQGDYLVFIGNYLRQLNKTYLPMTFEFGTLDSQTLVGALKSIDFMIRENQGFHHGFKTEKDREKVRLNIQQMFYPEDEAWRTKVLQQTREVLPKIIHRFQAL